MLGVPAWETSSSSSATALPPTSAREREREEHGRDCARAGAFGGPVVERRNGPARRIDPVAVNDEARAERVDVEP